MGVVCCVSWDLRRRWLEVRKKWEESEREVKNGSSQVASHFIAFFQALPTFFFLPPKMNSFHSSAFWISCCDSISTLSIPSFQWGLYFLEQMCRVDAGFHKANTWLVIFIKYSFRVFKMVRVRVHTIFLIEHHLIRAMQHNQHRKIRSWSLNVGIDVEWTTGR